MQQILLTLFYLLFFNFLIYRFGKLQFKNFKPVITHLLFNVKFLIGIFIWFIYTFYYTDVQNNDVHKFYTDALVVKEAATEHPIAFVELMEGQDDDVTVLYTSKMKNWSRNFDEAPFNENHTIIKLNALLMFISFKTYFVHILFFCFISLIGWVLLTNSILSFADARNSILALPVLFLPSVLFWTSGVMKEPLLVLGLGLLVYGIINDKWRKRRIAALVAGLLIVLFTKFFVLACLLPSLIAFLLFRSHMGKLFVLTKYVAVNAVMLLVALNIHYVTPGINLQQMLMNKQTHSVKEAEYFKAGSRIAIPAITTQASSVLKTIPVGIWNVMFRPYMSDIKNVMMLASRIENFLIVTFIILFITTTQWRNPANLNLFLFLMGFALAYFGLIGICTPVIGNLVRYKAPLLPVLLFAFIIKVNPKAVANTLSFVLRK